MNEVVKNEDPLNICLNTEELKESGEEIKAPSR